MSKTYTVYRRFEVEVGRAVIAESFADAEQKADALKFDRFLKSSPGADLVDWNDLSGKSIHEERE